KWVEHASSFTLREDRQVAPVLAMASNRGPLRERIFRVLGLTAMGTGIRSIGLAGSLLFLTAALAAGNTLLGLARPQVATLAKHAAFLPAQAQAAASPAQPAAKPAPTPAAKPTPARPQ